MSLKNRDKILLILVIIPILPISLVNADVDGEPDIGIVRVLYIGGIGSGGPLQYYVSLINDPFFDVSPVQGHIPHSTLGSDITPEVAQRLVRKYMPRNYGELANYDVISLGYPDAQLFKPEYKSWFSKAVMEESLALTFTGQHVGGHTWLWEWVESTVGEVLPIQRATSSESYGDSRYSEPAIIRVTKPEHPLMTSLPWSSMGRHGVMAGYTIIGARQGSEVLAEVVPTFGQAYPFLVWWDVGQGRSLAIMTLFSQEKRNPNDPFYDWPYIVDFACNYHLYAAGHRIPQEPLVIHEIRSTAVDSQVARNMLVESIEFISKLGGNTVQLEEMLREAEDKVREARQSYLNYEFETSLALAREVASRLGEIAQTTVKIKDQTLLSIYLIEWTVLMSTTMVTGVLMWNLMVKRRLYEEVKTTRMTKTPTKGGRLTL